jgi:hypothetical protein
MTRRLLPLMFGALLASLIGGCAQTIYDSDYTFVPQPAVIDIVRRDSGGAGQALTVLATVSGVRNADESRRLPRSVEVRLRFENNGTVGVHFDPNSLDLVTGSLRGFEPPELVPPRVLDLAPGERTSITAYFPFPRNDSGPIDLQNLRLRWQVKIGDEIVPQTAIFRRVEGGGGYDAQPQTPESPVAY